MALFAGGAPLHVRLCVHAIEWSCSRFEAILQSSTLKQVSIESAMSVPVHESRKEFLRKAWKDAADGYLSPYEQIKACVLHADVHGVAL